MQNYKIYNQGVLVQPRKRGQYARVGIVARFKAFCGRVWFWFKVSLALGSAVFAIGFVSVMAFSTSSITYVSDIQTVKAEENEIPILARIADCESGGGVKGGAHQFNKKGNTIQHPNSDGTIDYGYMQINSRHLAEAMQEGYNLFTEEGNRAYGKWMYENRGTQDWNSSRSCWYR